MGIERVKFQARKIMWGAKESLADLGILGGPIEVNIEPEVHEVKDDRLGDEPLATILKSSKVKIKATFSEIDKAFYKTLLDGFGLKAITPTGTGTTEVIAGGTGQNGVNLSANAKMLVLKPMNKTDDDKTEDIAFFKAIPKLSGGMKFTGNEQHNVEVEFTIIPDESMKADNNKFVIGDWSQAGLANA